MYIKYAPAYENNFMAQFEKQYIYLYIKNKSIIYLQYFNNMYMV